MTSPSANHQVPRAAAIVGLAGVALIHLLELQTKFQDVPYLGMGYVLLIVASVVAAALLVHSNSRAGWVIGGGAALGALLGYSMTRTIGLPQSSGDIGNWLEPIGLTSLFVEASVAALAGYAMATFSPAISKMTADRRRSILPIAR